MMYYDDDYSILVHFYNVFTPFFEMRLALFRGFDIYILFCFLYFSYCSQQMLTVSVCVWTRLHITERYYQRECARIDIYNYHI